MAHKYVNNIRTKLYIVAIIFIIIFGVFAALMIANKDVAFAVCKVAGGVVFTQRCNGYCIGSSKPTCAFQYRDAGKKCADDSQCKGFCKLTSQLDEKNRPNDLRGLLSPLNCLNGMCEGVCSGVSDDYYDFIKVKDGKAIDDRWTRPI